MSLNPLTWFSKKTSGKTSGRSPARPGVVLPPEMSIKPGSYTSLGYRAAQVARNGERRPAQTASADYEARPDRQLLVAESQRFDRDNGLYRGIINRAVDNIIGTGFSLQARGPHGDIIESLWRSYWKRPEARKMSPGWQIERMICRSLLVDGDLLAVKRNDGLFQLIESARIGGISQRLQSKEGNPIEQGVEMDADGSPIRYHIGTYGDFGLVNFSNPVIKPADVCLFIGDLSRVSATRGVPAMVSSFPMLHRLDDILDSEAIAWQLQARFALIHNDPAAAVNAYYSSKVDPEKDSDEKQPLRYQEFDQGIVFHAQPGSTLTPMDRKIPAQNFDSSVVIYLRLLGLPVGLPLELILLDWSRTNYSSARAALEQAHRTFTGWQKLLVESFYDEILSWKLANWIQDGLLPERALSDTTIEWLKPEFPWLDLLKEAQAWGVRLDRGLTTQSKALKASNSDYSDWIEARKNEILTAVKTAQQISEETGEKIPWTVFSGLSEKAQDSSVKAVAEANIGEENADIDAEAQQ